MLFIVYILRGKSSLAHNYECFHYYYSFADGSEKTMKTVWACGFFVHSMHMELNISLHDGRDSLAHGSQLFGYRIFEKIILKLDGHHLFWDLVVFFITYYFRGLKT